MKESAMFTLQDVNELLTILSEQLPIKYGNVFQQIQQLLQKKFDDNMVKVDNNNVSTYSKG
jgi:hypothetical protein